MKNEPSLSCFKVWAWIYKEGNAQCVMGTVAHHRKLEEIYNLGTIQTQEQEG